MTRPLSRRQHLENAAFLKALRQTGNIRLAARAVGMAPATLHGRRASHPAFAQEWDAAIAMAHADFAAQGGRAGPVAPVRPAVAMGRGLGAPGDDRGHRTRGGETVVVRRADGKLQVRAAQPGKLTRQCEQAFLTALAATANVRLSAAAAGAAVAAFYRRRRTNPAFAREMRLALEMGYERIEGALLAGFDPDAHLDDAWRSGSNELPPLPAMSVDQAMMLLQHHQKEVRFFVQGQGIRIQRGETNLQQSARLAACWQAERALRVEDDAVAEAARAAARESVPSWLEPPPPVLPALDQISGRRRQGKR